MTRSKPTKDNAISYLPLDLFYVRLNGKKYKCRIRCLVHSSVGGRVTGEITHYYYWDLIREADTNCNKHWGKKTEQLFV